MKLCFWKGACIWFLGVVCSQGAQAQNAPSQSAPSKTVFAQQMASTPQYNAETAHKPAPDEPVSEPAPMPDADIYAPGSTAQENQERQLKPAPGISLKVPLD
jgi:hypothetical protein